MRASLLALAAAALVELSPPAASQPRSPAWDGLWQGTIGGLPVRVCFAHPGSYPIGDYYYLSRLRLIPLEGERANPGAFDEGPGAHPTAARWRLTTAAGDAVTGTWTGLGRSLPIRLTRFARPSGEDWSCADRAFHTPRLAGVRIVERPAALGSLSYTRLILDHRGRFDMNIETFRLPGDSDAARRINAELVKPLGEGEGSWWDCIKSSLEVSPMEGDEDAKLEPTLVTRRWLVVRRNVNSFCGGAHPNTEVDHVTFDRATGRAVDPLGWLNQRAVSREPAEAGEPPLLALRPTFRAFVMAGAKPAEKECRGTVAETDYWDVEPTRTGFVFSPQLPHVALACTQDFAVPFAKLRPYLTAEGTAYVAEIEREGGSAATPAKRPR
jgi:hypothetical protein